MARRFNPKTLLPLTEPMYYTLLALTGPQHGYGIMQTVEKLSKGRVKLGAGTLYTLLARFLKNGIITREAGKDKNSDNERRKTYILSDNGKALLHAEYDRILSMVQDGKEIMDSQEYK